MSGHGAGARAALITGGAVRIGAAIVSRLATEGYGVAIHCRGSLEQGRKLAAEIIAKGGKAVVVQADLADDGQGQRLIADAAAALGPLTLLVNNASVFEDDSIVSLETARFERHVAVNLRSPLLLARDFAAQAPEGVHASIVNVIDQRVLRPDPRFFSYALTKAALWQATRTMAQALAPRIRVNAVAPGPTAPNPRDGEEGVAREAAATILGKRVRPGAIADAVLFLAEAKHVTGQMIAVDSGQHLGWRTPDVLATMDRD